MNLRSDTRSKTVNPTLIYHVTPTLSPSPRGRDLPSPSRGPSSKLRKLSNLLNVSANLRSDSRSKAISPTHIYHVTPTLNPSPRGRDLPSPSRALSSKLRKLSKFLSVSMNLRVATRSKAVSPTRVYHVTPTLNPSPRGRDLPSPSRALYAVFRTCETEFFHFTFLRKSSIVFSIRQVIVIGPTPPGTGVITDASGSTAS